MMKSSSLKILILFFVLFSSPYSYAFVGERALSGAAAFCWRLILGAETKYEAAGLHWPVFLKEMESRRPWENAFQILIALSDYSSFKEHEAKVLFLSRFRGASGHVVILYRGMIVEPDQMARNRLIEIRNRVVPLVPAANYFAMNHHYPESEIREIPASDYLTIYPRKGFTYFFGGMEGAGILEKDLTAENRFPKQSLIDYIAPNFPATSGG